jgi:hypothetical protein
MAILQALIAWLINSLGRVVSSAVAWATLLLFGKVPDNRRLVLSVISFTSLLWIVAAIGVILPRAGAFLLLLIRLPESFETAWVSLAMLILTFALPILNGFLSRSLTEQDDGKVGLEDFFAIASNGWRLTLALSVTLLMMVVIAPIHKISDIAKRWTSEHMPVVIEPQEYGAVTRELREILESAGIQCTEQKPSLVSQAPVWWLVLLTGEMLKRLVADRLTKIVYEDGELEIRPSDLVVRGTKKRTNDVVALLISHFGFGSAYLSWTEEANLLEDEMRDVWHLLQQRMLPRQAALDLADDCYEKLKGLHLAKDEWEILYRLSLKLKLDVWQSMQLPERKAS